MLKESLGRNISCGCHAKNFNNCEKLQTYHKKRNEEALNKIIGNTYCGFKVLELTEKPDKVYNDTKYNVECTICGFKTVYGRNYLSKSDSLVCQGCLYIKNKENIGKKFGKLTIIDLVKDGNETLYKSKCDCGEERACKLHRLESGHITSCGCHVNDVTKHITPEIILKRAQVRQDNNDKRWIYNRYMKNMRGAFRHYSNDGDTINIFKFFQLSQENCHYCGCEPWATFDYYDNSNNEFIYNGLDRINQKLPHTIDNCITCCKTCNYLKGSLNYLDFILWIQNISFNISKFAYNFVLPYEIKGLHFVSTAFNHYKNDTDIDIYTFSKLIKEPCYYCKQVGVNNRKGFRYNGLDRIDSLKNHELNNVVPCCKVCNYSKKDFTVEEWYNQIKAVKLHLSL